MSLKAVLVGVAPFRAAMSRQRRAWDAATLAGVREQTRATQLEVRRAVSMAFAGARGIGGRVNIAGAVRSKVYENRDGAAAAGIVFSKFGGRKDGRFVDYIAPRLFGATVVPLKGDWLMLPMAAAGRSSKSVRREGLALLKAGKLALLPIRGGRALIAVRKTRTRFTPYFVFVRRVHYPRRTSRAALMASAVRELPGRILKARARMGLMG